MTKITVKSPATKNPPLKEIEDMKVSELLNLQKDFKKFLKLGELDLAENIFSMLKTLCRNYRAA